MLDFVKNCFKGTYFDNYQYKNNGKQALFAKNEGVKKECVFR